MTSTREKETETEALLTKKTRSTREEEDDSTSEETMGGRVMTKSKFQTPFAFILLSFLTVLALGLSCVAEEYIIKQIPGFDFFWFLAFSELVVFSALTVLVQQCGWDEEEEEKEEIQAIDGRTLKKMKPPQLKEELARRGLSIQGNKKSLVARLKKYQDK